MRAVPVIAAVALLYAAGPAEAAPKRAGAPKVACAKGALAHAGRAGRPIAARRGAVRRAASRRAASRRAASRRAASRRAASRRARCAPARVGEAKAGRPGMPSTFAVPMPFATAPAAAAPGGPAPGGAPAAPGEPAGPVLPPVYSNPRAVQVRAYEFRFQLSKSSVSAGDVSVEFNLSAAEDPHDLWLVREDGTGQAHSFGETAAGAIARTTFPLTAGRWTLFCSLTGHQAAGMRSTLTAG